MHYFDKSNRSCIWPQSLTLGAQIDGSSQVSAPFGLCLFDFDVNISQPFEKFDFKFDVYSYYVNVAKFLLFFSL